MPFLGTCTVSLEERQHECHGGMPPSCPPFDHPPDCLPLPLPLMLSSLSLPLPLSPSLLLPPGAKKAYERSLPVLSGEVHEQGLVNVVVGGAGNNEGADRE